MSRDVSVVGGIYHERCLQPQWDQVFGSAGRAACAISGIASGRVQLRGYAHRSLRDRIAFEADLNDVELAIEDMSQAITFDYVHTLSVPIISPSTPLLKQLPAIHADNRVVIRYGMIESDAVVCADVAIYDPQSAFGAKPFRHNGSSADRLAIVLNRLEMQSITGTNNPREGAEWLACPYEVVRFQF